MIIKRLANNQIFKTITTLVEIIITILLIVLIMLTATQRFSEKGSFFGYRIFTVASGSMVPMYGIGDTLLVKNTSIDDIKIGDAVTYQASTTSGDKVNVTHEVIDVEIDPATGKYAFHTKGIANNVEDPIVSEDQVVGKVIYRFVSLSLIGVVTTNKVLLLTVIGVPLALLVAIEIIKMLYGDDTHLLKKVVTKNIKIAKTISEDEFDNKILSDEAKRKKVEAIRNGTTSLDNKTFKDTNKKMSEEDIKRKIEAIKNGNSKPLTKSPKDTKEAIDLESIKEIDESKNDDSTKNENEDDFLETVKLMKEKYKENSKEYDDKQIDEFLEYLKTKLNNEKK